MHKRTNCQPVGQMIAMPSHTPSIYVDNYEKNVCDIYIRVILYKSMTLKKNIFNKGACFICMNSHSYEQDAWD